MYRKTIDTHAITGFSSGDIENIDAYKRELFYEMGSKKNKENKIKYSYRHVYVKKWPAKANTSMTGIFFFFFFFIKFNAEHRCVPTSN